MALGPKVLGPLAHKPQLSTLNLRVKTITAQLLYNKINTVYI